VSRFSFLDAAHSFSIQHFTIQLISKN
jgi:hypothetical protein